MQRVNNRASNMIKGRIAEAIVEEMLKESEYKVYRFGYEGLLQNLTQTDKMNSNTVSEKIWSMPDFIVIDKDGKASFIEVKFSKDGRISGRWKRRVENHWSDGRLILVTLEEPYFRISSIGAFLRSGELRPIEKDNFIRIDKKLVDKYSFFVEKYFKKNKNL